MAMLWFALNNFLVVMASIVITDLTYRGRNRWRKALVTTALFPVIVLLTVLVTGTFGRLNSPSIAAALAVVLIAALLIRFRSIGVTIVDSAAGSAGQTALNSVFFRFAISAVMGIAIGYVLANYMLQGTAFSWDDLGYHAISPARWLIDQKLSIAPLSMPAHYPLNAETLSLWFMLPFHSDAYVGLAGIFWLGLSILAFIAAGVLSGHGKETILIFAALVAASPIVMTAVRSFSGVDIAGPAMLIAALVMAPSFPVRSRSDFYTDVIFSAILAGYALGCKVSLAPACAILFCWLIYRAGSEASPGTCLNVALIFVSGILVCGSFWYLRNIFLTGNPLFPAQVALWDGPVTPDYLNKTKLISWIVSAPANWNQWRFLIAGYVDWPIQFFILSLGGYMGVFYSFFRDTNSHSKSTNDSTVLLFLSGLTLAVAFFFMPFSGTNFGTTNALKADPRFLIAPFLIGLLLLAVFVEDTKWKKLWLIIIPVVVCIPLNIDWTNFLFNLTVIGVAGFALLLLWTAGSEKLVAAFSYTNIPAFFLPALLVLAFLEPLQKGRTDEQLFQSMKNREFVGAWQYLEELPNGSVLTQIGYHGTEYYPLFGRELQNRPVKVDQDGVELDGLHILWRQDPEKARLVFGQNNSISPLYFAYVHNLIESQVQYILVRKAPDQTRWSELRNVLKSSDRAVNLYSDSNNEIYGLDSREERK